MAVDRMLDTQHVIGVTVACRCPLSISIAVTAVNASCNDNIIESERGRTGRRLRWTVPCRVLVRFN